MMFSTPRTTSPKKSTQQNMPKEGDKRKNFLLTYEGGTLIQLKKSSPEGRRDPPIDPDHPEDHSEDLKDHPEDHPEDHSEDLTDRPQMRGRQEQKSGESLENSKSDKPLDLMGPQANSTNFYKNAGCTSKSTKMSTTRIIKRSHTCCPSSTEELPSSGRSNYSGE
jgi:hypothetical protein